MTHPHDITWPGIESDNPLINATVRNVKRLDERLENVEHKVDTLITMQGRNNDATDAMLAILTTFRGLYKAAKWVGSVAGALVALYGLTQLLK